jgi:1,4-alpha-glucan branching enzyme
MLLAQASDWQFIISTGAVPDYAERRFRLHCEDTMRLLDAIRSGTLEGAARLAEELWQRDRVFPDVLDAVAGALTAPAALP